MALQSADGATAGPLFKADLARWSNLYYGIAREGDLCARMCADGAELLLVPAACATAPVLADVCDAIQQERVRSRARLVESARGCMP